jgi:hypothetical protein
MAVDRDKKKPVLVREVMRPGREQTGVAVLLVAASALTFALAGSAFALWARSAPRCDHAHPPIATSVADAEPEVMIPPTDCGSATWSQNPDSSVTVQFSPCDHPAVEVQPASRVQIEETEGVVVYRIVK